MSRVLQCLCCNFGVIHLIDDGSRIDDSAALIFMPILCMKVFPEQLHLSLYISRCLSAFHVIKEMGLRNFLIKERAICIFLRVFVCLCSNIAPF